VAVKDQIAADLKEAMRARDQVKVDALRAVLSAFSYRKIEAGKELSDDEQLEVVRKQVKQRDDSIDQFKKGGREELAAKETRERDILVAYLPVQKSADEVRAVVRGAIASLPAGSNQGAVMKAVMPQLRNLADGKLVGQIVSEELAAAT